MVLDLNKALMTLIFQYEHTAETVITEPDKKVQNKHLL